MSSNSCHYEKPVLSLDQQILSLQSRGIEIVDHKQASSFLRYVSYFRLSGYIPELKTNSRDNSKTTLSFDKIIDSYLFDRKLRLIIMDALEQIEVGIRTVITNEMALRYGAHWYLEQKLFLNTYDHRALIKKIRIETCIYTKRSSIKHRKREIFIHKYFQKYISPPLPPIWMIAELLPFGTWSIIYANLKDRSDQKIICDNFGINFKIMTSWLHSLSYLRNLCAHHSRLWDRDFTLVPMISKKFKNQLFENRKFSAQAAVMQIFLKNMSLKNNWASRLIRLVTDRSIEEQKNMGFKNGWQNDDFWS